MDLEKLFFDRKNTLAILKKRVIDLKDGYRQNVALLGPQHIGKTSILHKFVSDLDDPELITIYLDLDQKDFKYIFCNFVGSILYNFAKSKQLAYPNLLVLQKGDDRLILAFNAGSKPLKAVIFNKQLKSGQKAEIFEKEGKLNPSKIYLTIPPRDVVVIHIK